MTRLEIELIGAALLVLALVGFVFAWDRHQREIGSQAIKAAVAVASAEAAASASAESARRITAQEGIAHDAQLQAQAASQTAADAVRARDSFRVRLDAAVRAAHAGHPASAPAGDTADSTVDLFAGLLDSANERAATLAAYADQSRIAGLACQSAYLSLTH